MPFAVQVGPPHQTSPCAHVVAQDSYHQSPCITFAVILATVREFCANCGIDCDPSMAIRRQATHRNRFQQLQATDRAPVPIEVLPVRVRFYWMPVLMRYHALRAHAALAVSGCAGLCRAVIITVVIQQRSVEISKKYYLHDDNDTGLIIFDGSLLPRSAAYQVSIWLTGCGARTLKQPGYRSVFIRCSANRPTAQLS